MFWHLSEEIAANVCQMLSMENYGDSIVVLVTQQGVLLCYAFCNERYKLYLIFCCTERQQIFIYEINKYD